MSFKTWISSSLAALALAATLLPAAPARAQVTPVPFVGGGTLYNFIDCEAQGWLPGQMVTARFALSDAEHPYNSLTLFFDHGALNLQIRNPLVRTTTYTYGWGSAYWDRPGSWDPRPRMRVRLVDVLAPSGGTIETATELHFRLQVSGFNWMRLCRATAEVVLARELP